MAEVKAKVQLLKHQFKFVSSASLFPALVGGFGCGKTEALLYRALRLIMKNGPEFKKKSLGQYIIAVYEPTYDLVVSILHPRFESLLELYRIPYTLNKTEKTITLPSLNSKIMLRTMENPEKIVGYETADAIIDELDTLPEEKAEEVFTRIVSRNRLNKFGDNNTVAVCTTPEGFRFVYKMWKLKDIKAPLRAEDFELIQGKTEDNIYLPITYVESLKSQYPASKLKAYLNGEFVNLKGLTVYDSFDRELNNTKEIIRVGEDLHIGMDFNVGKMSAIVAVIRNGIPFVLDEIFGVLDTPAMIKEINKRYGAYNIYVYPDASGKNRKSNDASETDISLLKEYFVVKAKLKNPRVKDRVMSVQSLFLNMKGEKKLFINSKLCPTLVDNLEQQIFDDNGEPDKKGGQDHMLDALGYFIYWHFGINKTKMRVIDSPI